MQYKQKSLKFFQSLKTVVGLLVVVGASGISCMLHDIPILQVGGYIISALPGIAGNVVSSATVEVYPTALR